MRSPARRIRALIAPYEAHHRKGEAMTFNPTTSLPKVNRTIETEYLRRILTVLILFALLFVVAGMVVFVTRGQNPSCADLRKRVDDATRQYQTVLTQSQSMD